jgi:hypothetical protein
MSLTLAKRYVARPLGGAGNPDILDMAAEAIQRGYTDWQNKKFWTFLLKDTSATTAVTGVTATGASATVNAPSAGAFDFVNVGQTVTISSGTATLAASTTVSSVARGLDGVITSMVLSNAFGGTTNTNATLTFSADIPILLGVSDYNVPNDFKGAQGDGSRLIDGPKTPVAFIDIKSWDRATNDQALSGLVEMYTTYNPVSEGTQNFGTSRIRVFKVPDANYTLRMKYYRKFNVTATTIDVPDAYLYQFLDYCRGLLLEMKVAMENPAAMIQKAAQGYQDAQDTDEAPNDEDEDARLKSPYESVMDRPIVGNGQFDPYPF